MDCFISLTIYVNIGTTELSAWQYCAVMLWNSCNRSLPDETVCCNCSFHLYKES